MFRDVCRFWRVQNKNPSKLRRNGNDKEPTSPDTARTFCSTSLSPISLLPSACRSSGLLNRRWTEVEVEEEGETENGSGSAASSPSEAPFRERASTDGNLLQKPWRWRYPPPSSGQSYYPTARADRRMSISMRGNNASY